MKFNFQLPWNFLWKDTVEVQHDKNGFIYRYKLLPPVIHCENEPAIEYPNSGAKCWFQNGVRHRVDGPAIDFGIDHPDNCYFIRGKEMSKKEYEARDKKKDSFSWSEDRIPGKIRALQLLYNKIFKDNDINASIDLLYLETSTTPHLIEIKVVAPKSTAKVKFCRTFWETDKLPNEKDAIDWIGRATEALLPDEEGNLRKIGFDLM